MLLLHRLNKHGLVLDLEREVWEGEWSTDGQWLIYRLGIPPSRDLYVKHIHADSVGRTISARDASQEIMPTLSPNGRWLAYLTIIPRRRRESAKVEQGDRTRAVLGHLGVEWHYKFNHRDRIRPGEDAWEALGGCVPAGARQPSA